MLTRLPLLFALTTLVVGCAPSVSPLYRDYVPRANAQAERSRGEDAYLRLRAALASAGWSETEPTAPHVLSTAQREFGDWGLYEVLVSLDVVPMGNGYLRDQFHPVRHYFTGATSKIPSLSSGLRQAILPDLNEALEAQGFRPLDVPRERDEDQAEGT